jgi:tetratricopeptide (TPR) repeat protein
MKSSAHEDVLALLRHYLSKGSVDDLLGKVGGTERMERSMLNSGLTGPGYVSIAEGEALDQCITYCQDNLSTGEFHELMIALGEILQKHGHVARAIELYGTVIVMCSNERHEAEMAEAYLRRANAHCQQTHWEQATDDLLAARAVFLKRNDNLSTGRVENTLGTIQAELGKLTEAIASFEKALEAFEASGNFGMIGMALMNLGIVKNIAGTYDAALRHYKRAQSYFEKAGDPGRIAELHHNMGMTYLNKGEYKDASREFDWSLSLGTQQHNMNLLALASLGKANVYYRLNDLTMALKLVNKALEPFTSIGDRLSVADSYKVKGMIHREMKKYNFAESYLLTSLRMNLELKNHLNAAETYFEIGLLEQQRGNARQATAAFEQAHKHFVEIGARGEAGRVEVALHELRSTPNEI